MEASNGRRIKWNNRDTHKKIAQNCNSRKKNIWLKELQKRQQCNYIWPNMLEAKWMKTKLIEKINQFSSSAMFWRNSSFDCLPPTIPCSNIPYGQNNVASIQIGGKRNPLGKWESKRQGEVEGRKSSWNCMFTDTSGRKKYTLLQNLLYLTLGTFIYLTFLLKKRQVLTILKEKRQV